MMVMMVMMMVMMVMMVMTMMMMSAVLMMTSDVLTITFFTMAIHCIITTKGVMIGDPACMICVQPSSAQLKAQPTHPAG